VAVVTVSRQFGAGGVRLAAGLGEVLGFHVVGRELVEEAARRLGLDPEVAEGRDERAPALVDQIGMALAAGTAPFGAAPPPQIDARAFDDNALAEATRKVITSLADAGGYVILGRGAQAALSGRPDACHVSLVGELGDRAARIMRWQNVDEREAMARCERTDADRARYVRHFYGRDIRDPLLYDCVLNTSTLGLETAARVAIAVAKRKLSL
jgi:cytidylate kinase